MQYIDKNKIELYRKHMQMMVDKYGYYAHFLSDGIHVNIHTHALDVTYGHTNLEIVLCKTEQEASRIFREIVDKYIINQGIQIEENVIYNIEGYDKLKFVKVDYKSKIFGSVLRIIFPDQKGLFPEDDGCDEQYTHQYEVELCN